MALFIWSFLTVMFLAQSGDPIQQACTAVQQALQRAGAGIYLRPLLTSHLLLGEVQQALALIKKAKEAQLAAASDSGKQA